MFRRNSLRRLILLGIPLMLLAGLYWRYHPQPITKNAAQADTTIQLTVSSGAVLFPGDCIEMRWQVEYGLRVLANDELSPAVGEKTLCIFEGSQPTLQVMLMDGGEVSVSQPITILAAQPAFMAIVLIALALLCLSLSTLLLRAGRGAAQFITIRSIAKTLGAILIAVGITLVILEIALSTYFESAGSREQKIMYLYSLDEIRALQSNVMPLPYVSYAPDPAYEGHNALGYRGPEIALPKPPGIFRIVAMGGSTTYSTGTTAAEAYPAYLQAILRDDFGYDQVEVINAGVSGYTSWEALASFAFRVLELQPDMLIYYAALNDLTVRERLDSDCYRGKNPQRGLNGHRGLFVERNAELPASALYRLLAISAGWMSNPLALDSAFEPSRVQCERDPGETTLEKRLAINTPVYYDRNIRNLVTLALANNVQPVLSSWAYNVEAARPELWRESIAQHNAVTRQIAADMDVPYIHLAEDFPVNSAYWEIDGVHLVAAGTYEQASRYAAFLDDSGLLPQPEVAASPGG